MAEIGGFLIETIFLEKLFFAIFCVVTDMSICCGAPPNLACFINVPQVKKGCGVLVCTHD